MHYRKAAFDSGLQAIGLKESAPHKCDVLLIWNRYGRFEQLADAAEARGARVLIAENATWGNDFLGGKWLSLWSGFHNRAQSIKVGGPERWDRLGMELMPWRTSGEIVGLPQRGIGPKGTPRNWIPPGCDRIRPHPGTRPCKPLEDDLARAGEVRTWGSGAAVKALLWGIPVRSWMPDWCAEQDNTDEGRLKMLRSLAWAQWTLPEIIDGSPFRHLLFDHNSA
ncbi:MAG: hypothetical protein WC736_14920 [Gallionella sp.]|jgi:hypothetical protein